MRSGRVVAALGLALLVGGMVFFGAVAAPLVFTQLPAAAAAGFIRVIFPFYFGYVAVAAAVAMVGFILRVQIVSAFVMLLVLAAVLWAWLWLVPHLNGWREAGDMVAFDRGHEVSTWLNGGELAAAIWLLVRLVLT